MSSVDVASLHSYEVPDELVGRVHDLLEELNDDCMEFLLERGVSPEKLLVQELAEDPDQFIVDEGDTLQTGLFQPFDLLLDDEFKCRRSHEQSRRRTRRVVKYCADVNVLDLVERIHGLDTIGVEFVEDEADTGTSGQLHARQLLAVAVQNRTIFVAEFGNDVEDDIGAVPEDRVSQLH